VDDRPEEVKRRSFWEEVGSGVVGRDIVGCWWWVVRTVVVGQERY